MVMFSRTEHGTAEDTWLATARWLDVAALRLGDIDGLVVVSAHPDDESLGAAGLMARVAWLGVPIRVIVASNGEASHPHSPTVTPAELSARRTRELVAALAEIAPEASVDFLDLPDSALADHEGDLDDRLAELRISASTLVLAPWRHDGHADHEAVGRAAARLAHRAGAALLEYPVWMWHWAHPDSPEVPWAQFATLALHPEERTAKSAAIAAHESQVTPLSDRTGDEAVLTDSFHEHFIRPFEVYVTNDDSRTLDERYFDGLYRDETDPWRFESRWYEERKRAIMLASLPRRSFASALEIGCSIGVTTAELARRCSRLTAVDIARKPVEVARRRLAGDRHVRVEHSDVTTDWPWGEAEFDLVVLSEVGYYWSTSDLRATLARVDRALAADGVIVACHWRHPVAEYVRGGDEVHDLLRESPGFDVLATHLEEDFRLDVLVRSPGVSVARAIGLV